MFVYFLRHASAGESIANPARDEKRPLDEAGIEQCRFVGRLLNTLDVHVDAILSSPLKRATQTASLVGNEIGFESRLQLDPALRPESDFESFRQMLRKCASMEAVMVVGHNPSMERFLSLLITGGQSENAVEMKKGAVARVQYSPKRAQLDWLLTPKIARTAYSSSKSSLRPKTSRK